MLTNLNLCILKSVAYLCIAVWWQYWILSQIPTSVKLGGWGGVFGKTTNSICFSALQCKGQLSSTLIHKIWFLSPVILWSKIFSYDLWKAPSQIGKGISERERERGPFGRHHEHHERATALIVVGVCAIPSSSTAIMTLRADEYHVILCSYNTALLSQCCTVQW